MTTFKLILGKKEFDSISRISLCGKISLENVCEYKSELEYKPVQQHKNVFYVNDIKYSEDIESFLFKQLEKFYSISSIQIFCENEFYAMLGDVYYFFLDCGFKLIEVFVYMDYSNYDFDFDVNKKEDIYDVMS